MIFLSFYSNAQLTELTPDAKMYYALYNQASDVLYIEKDTTKAIGLLEEAKTVYLNKIKFGFCSAIGRLKVLYLKTGKNKEAYDCMVLEIKQNSKGNDPKRMVPNKWLRNDIYINFRESKYWTMYQDNFDSLTKDATKDLNWSLIAEYKGIGVADQLGRGGDFPSLIELSEDSLYDFNRVKVAMFKDIDRKILVKQLEIIKDNGFLEYKDVGGKFSLNSMFLMHQFCACEKDSSKQWVYPYLDSLLLDKVYRGYYPPDMYAFHKDRSYTYLCQQDSLPQIYGHWVSNRSKEIIGELMDIENIDELRANIGLGSFYVYCKGKGIELPEGYVIPKRYMNLE